MDEGDEFPPPPPHLPPEPTETLLDVEMRSMAEAAIERAASLMEIQMASGGRPPARETQSVVEIVRASTDPCVNKSLNDNNYTALETGWIGDSIRYHATDSRHYNRGFIPLDLLPENTDFEVRIKAKQLFDFHRVRGATCVGVGAGAGADVGAGRQRVGG